MNCNVETGTYLVDNLTYEQNFVYCVPYEEGSNSEDQGNAEMREGDFTCSTEGQCSCFDEAGGTLSEGSLVI